MSGQGMDLSRRFLKLAADKRRVFLTKLQEQGLTLASLPIPAGEAGDLAPASFAQQRLWFIDQLESDSSAYHLPGALQLTGELHQAALQQALDTLAQRHHSLRTVFTTDGEGQPLQRILPPASVAVETVAMANEAELQPYAEAFARRPFDLIGGPLWRVALVTLADNDHRLLLCLHHIIADGWSIQVLLGEFAHGYRVALEGRVPELPALKVHYEDVALWQRCVLEAGGADADLKYWLDQLQGELPVLELPADRPRPPQQSFRGGRYRFALDARLATDLKTLARSRGASLFAVLLAACKILLFRLSGQDDLCVGVPIAGRNRAEVENLIGFFVNTQVLRSRLDSAESFDGLLARVQQCARQAQVHQELPFEYLVDHLQPERSLSYHPLFQVLYNHQQRDQERFELAPGLTAELMPQETGTAQFDLALHTWEFSEGHDRSGGAVAGNWNYATDLFDESTIARIHQQFERLLAEIVAAPERAIGDYDLLDEADRCQLAAWNDTFADHGSPEPVHRQFERMARLHPQREALVVGDQRLNYGELNARANRLAHHLIGQGVSPDSLVGVAAERSIELVVALYAIHKAGAAYVPIDPDHPPARQQQILASAGIDLLLTHTAVADRLPEPGPVQLIELDTLDLSDQPDTVPVVSIHPQQRAYVLYTSGSTGQPKGVANTHDALCNRLRWMQSAYPLDASDTVLQKTPYSFDVSVWEFFWPLMTGARLVVAPPGDHKDPAKLAALIRQAQVTTLHFVPSMLSAFLAQPDLSDCASLRRILCSGEALPRSLQDQTLSRLPEASLYNLYGPTEAAIDVTHWTCREDDRITVPIGRPIDNLQIHILDPRLNEQPIGVPGELYIGGAGLAREYHRRPDLTAERFIPSPFRTGERLYRSGDLARWCPDGTVEYLGRLDHQIKLRGQRIELGEIEAVLRVQPGVQDAVVLTRDERLVGYLQGGQLDRDAILTDLKRRLPEYMVPVHLVTLAAFPLSANGKLDRKALPRPELETAHYEAPRNDTERMLADLWQDILGLDRVGRQDNFFALGGDSILSLRIIARAQSLGFGLTPRDLFERQTIAELAIVQPLAPASQHKLDPERAFPLTPIQRWFFEQPMPQRSHWNQSLLLRPKQPLQTGALVTALNAVINHHDGLRLVFSEEQGSWSQRYRGPADDHEVLWQRTCAPDGLAALFEQAQTSLDIINGPLIRAVHVRLPDISERLLLVIHHLVVDGVSWRILLDDLTLAYEQACAGTPPEPGPRGASFQSWSDRLTEWAQTGLSEAERAWWAAIPQPPPLPGTRHNGANTVACQEQQTLVLDRGRTRELLGEASRAFRTGINDLLLTALGQALQRWAGLSDPVIALEGHGRDHGLDGPDLARSVGWFTSLYPVRLSNRDDLITSLKVTKEALRAVPRGGLGYGILRWLQGEPGLPDLSAAIAFNYLGQLDRGDQAPLVLADESPGPMRGPEAPLGFELVIDGQVRGGCLELVCSYSRERHDASDVAALMAAFRQALDEVLAVCRDQCGLTPSDVPLAGLDQAALDQLPLSARDIDDILPLTPMQQGLLFHSEVDDAAGLYINQLSVAIDQLPVAAFRAAWARAVARHPALRAGFIFGPGGQSPLQVIQRQAQLVIREIDGRDQRISVAALQEQERTTPFDLSRPPLMRLVLVRLTDSRWQMIWTLHHILLDGWSSAALLSEILQDTLGTEPSSPARYRDYFHWLVGRDSDQSDAFWRHHLEDLYEPTRLAPLLKRSRTDNGEERTGPETSEIALPLDRERLESFARQQQVTLNTLVQAAWVLVLQRYTGQRQVTFGATVAGRPSVVTGMDRQIGLFINTLPVVQAPRPSQRVSDWLAELQASNLTLQEHGHTPLYRIQQLAGQPGQELFDSLLVFENFPVDKALRGKHGGPRLADLTISERTHYPVSLSVESGQALVLRLYYRTESVDSELAGQLARHLQHMVERLQRGPEQFLGDLALVSGHERSFWTGWNRPAHPPVAPRPICALIADQARTQPEAVAVVHGNQRLSFARFNARANQLAHWLIRQGAGPESRVGVALERSVDMLVALLAVHKAGAAYVPLDPDYPPARLRYMLGDAGVSLLLSHTAAWDQLPETETERVNLDDLDLRNEPDTDPQVTIHPDQLAYLIYTSGSTGQPKGVAVTHGGLSMHCQTIGARYEMTSADRELHFLSISFDGAHERWLTALSHGARVVLRDQSLWSAQQTFDCLQDHGITVAAFPPGYLRQLSDWAELKGEAPALRVLCFAGEAFSRTLMHHVIRHLKPQTIINGYGPTETVVTPTLWQVSADTADFDSAYAPIGDLVGDRQGYVLDDHLNLLPPGIAGELYLGGALARGYLDRPAATAERFVPNPFRRGERFYRTGDRVRLNRDGQLEYLGRMDQQIKLRGYRIETGEVEAALKACPGVTDAVALVREITAGPRLVGYVCGEALDERHLKAQLKEGLPEYMVPSHLVLLARLPQLPNGKLDRNALPEPQVEAADYQAPADAREILLADIWQNLLGIGQVGRDDNFFALGGDSIQSLGLITRLREAGWQLSARSVFLSPRLEDMAAALEPLAEMDHSRQHPRAAGELPLTPIQAHFFDQPARNLHHWNQSVLLAVHQPLDTDPLRGAVAAVIAHHDSFRLAFRQDPSNGRWLSHYRPGESVERIFRCYRLTGDESVTALCDRIQRSFRLDDGPLAAVALIDGPDGQRLFLCAHHLMVDGVSWRILLEDLVRAYTQLEAGQPISLTPVGTGYQQWAESLSQAVAAGRWTDEVPYWAGLAGAQDPWPVDNPDGRASYGDGSTLSGRLSREQTQQLLRYTLAAHGTGMDELLLAVLTDALADWGGMESVLVAVEGHGREPVFPDLDCNRTLGWFTCLYPMALKSGASFAETLKQVQRGRARLPGKGIGFGVLRYLAEPEVRAALRATGEPLVVFNYLGQLDGQTSERFSPAPESPGMAVDPHTPMARELEVTGQVLNGQLTLNLQYSSQRYRQRTIQRLLDNLMDCLEAVIGSSKIGAKTKQVTASPEPVNRPCKPENGPRPLVRLAGNANSGGPTLFCPHPVSGTVVGYYPLAATLAPDWQVWGIQNRQILDRRWRDTSLAEMAEDYVHFLLEQQPRGPFHLIGWSMGGALALEMSAILEQQGRPVAFVGLIDPYVPGAGEKRTQAADAPVPADVHQDQWQQLLALEHHMRGLAADHRGIQPVTAPVHAWWARRSSESNRGGEALLSQFLGRPLSSSVWLDEDHLSIVRSGELKAMIHSQLAPMAARWRTPETQNVTPVGA